MKHNKLCSSFLMQASILLTVVIGVIVFTPFALTTAASADQVAQVIEHSEDLLVDEISVDVPRHQTLYFNGLQWGATIGWNPYSDSMNNAMALANKKTRVYQYGRLRICITCSMANNTHFWPPSPGHGVQA
jgi:hypothetical protein